MKVVNENDYNSQMFFKTDILYFLVKQFLAIIVAFVLVSALDLDYLNAANEPNDENIEDVEEVIVIASKTIRPLKDEPIRTNIVSKEKLEALHVKKLEDALQYIPGLHIQELHGKTGSGVWIQGFDSDRVLILIDSNPLIPSTGSSVDISQIAIGDIERIEITKGTVSARYGSSAIGGVVNVITKEPTDRLSAKIELQSGNWFEQSKPDNPFAKNSLSAAIATKQQRWSLQAVVDMLNTDGFSIDHNLATSNGWHGYKNNFSTKFTYNLKETLRFTWSPRYYSEDAANYRHEPGFGNERIPSSTYRDITERNQINVILEQTEQKVNWKLQTSQEDYENISTKASNRISTGKYKGLNYDVNFLQSNSHWLTTGIFFNEEFLDVVKKSTSDKKEDEKEVDDKTKTEFGVFVDDRWLVNDNLEINPGIRVINSPRFGNKVIPSINSLYSLNNKDDSKTLNFRFGIGNGYRSPNLKELYFTFDHSQLGYVVYGNEDLKPEESLNIQLSSEYTYKSNNYDNKSVRMEVNIFFNEINNLIETSFSRYLAEANENSALHKYLNINKAKSSGYELALECTTNNQFKWDVNYVYLFTENMADGSQLPRRPIHNIKAGFTYNTTEHSSLIVRANYESKHFVDEQNLQMSPEFATLDIKFNNTIDQNKNWYVGINNITGEQRMFDGIDFRPKQGRFIYLGASWKYSEK